MRAAAIEAGLVQSARAGDIHWRDRLRIITYARSIFSVTIYDVTSCLSLANPRPLQYTVRA